MRYVLCPSLFLIGFLLITGCDFSTDESGVVFSGESSHWMSEIILDEKTGNYDLVMTPKDIQPKDLIDVEINIELGLRSQYLKADSLAGIEPVEPISIQVPEDLLYDQTRDEVLSGITVSWDQQTEYIELEER